MALNLGISINGIHERKIQMAKNETGTELEVLGAKPIAAPVSSIGGVNIGGTTFSVKKNVNIPTLKHDTGETLVFKILAPIQEKRSTETKTVKIGGVDQQIEEEKIINIASVLEVHSQAEFQYVCNAITASNLREAYPNDGYVGKWFAVRKGGTVAGRRYKDVQIVEIEPEGEAG